MTDEDLKTGTPERLAGKARAAEHPPAKDVLARGITTKGTIALEERTPPPVLAPEPTPDDPAGWRAAVEKADCEHAEAIARKKDAFKARFEKSREAFDMAQNYQDRTKGYER